MSFVSGSSLHGRFDASLSHRRGGRRGGRRVGDGGRSRRRLASAGGGGGAGEGKFVRYSKSARRRGLCRLSACIEESVPTVGVPAVGVFEEVKPGRETIEPHESVGEATSNAINILMGVGLLGLPYAFKLGGWMTAGVVGTLWGSTLWTGGLLAKCQATGIRYLDGRAVPRNLDKEGILVTYEDIGEACFGSVGRTIVTLILYTELLGTGGLFLLLEADHLQLLFGSSLSGLTPTQVIVLAALLITPTTWLPDLSALSRLGVVGSLSAVSVAAIIAAQALGHPPVDSTSLLVPSTLPLTTGIVAFVFAGHAVFPAIHSSMADRSKFPDVLNISYSVVGLTTLLVAVGGYWAYGDGSLQEVTRNLPQGLASNVATSLILVAPMTKMALTLEPVAIGIQSSLKESEVEGAIPRTWIRTSLVFLCLGMAIGLPDFALFMSYIGALLTMLVSVIFPVVFYLRLYGGEIEEKERLLCYGVIFLGLLSSSSAIFLTGTGTL